MRLRFPSSLLVVGTAVAFLVTPIAGTAAAAPATCTLAAPAAAPAAQPFTSSAPASAGRDNAIPLLDGFSTISPLVRNQNLATAIAINATASPAEQQYAVDDNYAIGGPAVFNALGDRLSTAFFDALGAGELPKTAELLVGEDALIAPLEKTTAEKAFFDNPRPFEVAPNLIRHYGDGRPDLYEAVRGSGSYPSGHTTFGYVQATLAAYMVPELGPQLLARAADYGYHRIVLGVHYPLDVISGRIVGQSAVANALADPAFATRVAEASTEVRAALTARAGGTIAQVAECQTPYVTTADALAGYQQRMTYGFLANPVPNTPVQVPANAVNLLRTAHPDLDDAQLTSLLVQTALPAGYPLDKSGPDGGWQRLDLARAWAAPARANGDSVVLG